MPSKPPARSSRPPAGQNAGTPNAPAAPPLRPRLLARLFDPVDITPLVYFRITFALLMLWLGWKYFHGWDLIGNRPYNLIKYHYIDPRFHFTYPGFEWVTPWPGDGMYVHCYVVGLAATLIAVGLFYRAAAVAFFLGFTYLFLLDQARYLHHYYLICLLGLLLIFLPAHRKFSLDALLRPGLRSDTAPAWTLWLLRLQFGVVYFYAGVAKCTSDWLHGEPVRTMLAYKQQRFPDAGLFTRFFTEEWFVGFVAYGGLLFDLLVFPLLLFRKTRWFAFAGALAFHLANTQLFDIDIFPWMALSATFILFFPDCLPFGSTQSIHATVNEDPGRRSPPRLTAGRKWTAGFVIAYALVQLLLPLRPFCYAGHPNWTDEGRKFSWRMLSRDFRPTRAPRFFVKFRKDGRTFEEEFPLPKDLDFWLRDWQFGTMLKSPDLILQFVHLQAGDLRRQGAEEIDVRVSLEVSLNGREPQMYIDPSTNLAIEPRRIFTAYPWILPLTKPLPERGTETKEPAKAYEID